MRIEVIRCDICKREHDAQYILSPEWLTVIQSTKHGTQQEQHFCSHSCLITWARSSLTAQQLKEADKQYSASFVTKREVTE